MLEAERGWLCTNLHLSATEPIIPFAAAQWLTASGSAFQQDFSVWFIILSNFHTTTDMSICTCILWATHPGNTEVPSVTWFHKGKNKILFIGVVKGKTRPSPKHCYRKKENSWVFTNQDIFKEDSQGERKIDFKHRRSLNEKLQLEVWKAGKRATGLHSE